MCDHSNKYIKVLDFVLSYSELFNESINNGRFSMISTSSLIENTANILQLDIENRMKRIKKTETDYILIPFRKSNIGGKGFKFVNLPYNDNSIDIIFSPTPNELEEYSNLEIISYLDILFFNLLEENKILGDGDNSYMDKLISITARVFFIYLFLYLSFDISHKMFDEIMNGFFNGYKDIIKVDKMISFINNMTDIEKDCSELFECDDILEYIIPGAIDKLKDAED